MFVLFISQVRKITMDFFCALKCCTGWAITEAH